MKSAFLVPFMGPLPPYFAFWAKSCEINKRDFHWFVYSDQIDTKRAVNDAVTLIPYTYGAMIAAFKQYLNIDIDDSNPRRICDYRLLFYFLRRDHEQLDQFAFIGYTDMDVIYGELSRHVPENMERYTMISGDSGHPCGPFTLIRSDRVRALSSIDAVRTEMMIKEHRSFNESEAFLRIVSDGADFWCRADPLQPAMAPPISYQNNFSIWNNGKITVYDSRGHKKEGGFHHFSRYKNRKSFRVCADPQRDLKWAVCKKGFMPVDSKWTLVRLWFSLIT